LALFVIHYCIVSLAYNTTLLSDEPISVPGAHMFPFLTVLLLSRRLPSGRATKLVVEHYGGKSKGSKLLCTPGDRQTYAATVDALWKQQALKAVRLMQSLEEVLTAPQPTLGNFVSAVRQGENTFSIGVEAWDSNIDGIPLYAVIRAVPCPAISKSSEESFGALCQVESSSPLSSAVTSSLAAEVSRPSAATSTPDDTAPGDPVTGPVPGSSIRYAASPLHKNSAHHYYPVAGGVGGVDLQNVTTTVAKLPTHEKAELHEICQSELRRLNIGKYDVNSATGSPDVGIEEAQNYSIPVRITSTAMAAQMRVRLNTRLASHKNTLRTDVLEDGLRSVAGLAAEKFGLMAREGAAGRVEIKYSVRTELKEAFKQAVYIQLAIVRNRIAVFDARLVAALHEGVFAALIAQASASLTVLNTSGSGAQCASEWHEAWPHLTTALMNFWSGRNFLNNKGLYIPVLSLLAQRGFMFKPQFRAINEVVANNGKPPVLPF
jgi:hypothetical protein